MAQHRKAPDRTFLLRVGSTKKKIISKGLAHEVVKAEFPDATIPGESYALGLRFHSPTWGWIHISWRDTIEDDYADPQVKEW